jgi:hypothetical protein
MLGITMWRAHDSKSDDVNCKAVSGRVLIHPLRQRKARWMIGWSGPLMLVLKPVVAPLDDATSKEPHASTNGLRDAVLGSAIVKSSSRPRTAVHLTPQGWPSFPDLAQKVP